MNNETEADTRAQRIDPVLASAGWGKNGSRVGREVICPGRIQSGGRRGKAGFFAVEKSELQECDQFAANDLDDLRQSLLQKALAGELT